MATAQVSPSRSVAAGEACPKGMDYELGAEGACKTPNAITEYFARGIFDKGSQEGSPPNKNSFHVGLNQINSEGDHR